MDRRQIYQRVSSRLGINVRIEPKLCFYNPKEVYNALTHKSDVTRWLEFISNHYVPPQNKKVLLLYPCSNIKPYQKSRSYRILSSTVDKLGDQRQSVHLMTISEPFGLVPEEFYGKKTKWHDWENEWYDCPGLFEWWCDKYHQPYSKEHVNQSIECLAKHVAEFLLKANSQKSYLNIVAFIRTYTSRLETKKDHTHRRIIEKAAEIAKVDVEILPDKTLVSKIVRSRGRMAWDMYGVAHPMAQDYLLKHLKRLLNGEGH